MILTDLEATILGVILEGILYGAYVVLFILYLALQHRYNRGFGGPVILAQMLLFGLCTVSMCLSMPMAYFYRRDTWCGVASKLNFGIIVIFTITDSLAQMILLYRCWMVWGRRWVVVAVPGFLVLMALGGGIAALGLFAAADPVNYSLEGAHQAYLCTTAAYSISLVANALITSLIVIKIFLASREVCPDLGSNLHQSLRVITAMLIESGLLMFAFQLVLVVLFSMQHIAISFIAFPITQICGITTALLNIRVVVGSTYGETTEKIPSLRFAHSGEAAAQTTGPSTSAAEAQSRNINTEPDGGLNNERVMDIAA
ncbi:hypothetical protein BD779DRAFT_534842 [Infundibulicybe gibba]|nr:hypothetical protein BD779DRAFT_534842 [Infundibulicybe gibba]